MKRPGMLQALASMGLQRGRHDRATELTEGKARESTFLTSFQVMPTHFEAHYEKCTQISIAAGFLGGSVVKNLPANEGDEGSIPGSVRKIPWRRKWQPTPLFLPRKSHGQRSLTGYSSWGCKESDST